MKPYRPSNEITQAYNDGVVRIYTVTDAARPGYMPQPQATLKTKNSVSVFGDTTRVSRTRLTSSASSARRGQERSAAKIWQLPKTESATTLRWCRLWKAFIRRL